MANKINNQIPGSMYPEVGSWLIMILCTIGQSNSSKINNNAISIGPFPVVRNHFNVVFFIIMLFIILHLYGEMVYKRNYRKARFPGPFLTQLG